MGAGELSESLDCLESQHVSLYNEILVAWGWLEHHIGRLGACGDIELMQALLKILC
jgi:hypothetical protein